MLKPKSKQNSQVQIPNFEGRQGQGSAYLDGLYAGKVLEAHALVAVRVPKHRVLPALQMQPFSI